MYEEIFPEDALLLVDDAKRVSGGSSWADAVFRRQAKPKSYAKTMIKNVIHKNDLIDEQIECFFEESHFIITRQDKLLAIKGYAFVELHRHQGVDSFEEWLKQLFTKRES